MISPVSSTNTAATDETRGLDAGKTISAGDTIDQQEFLMLFIAQLQNQDPTNPLDTNGLTQQLAQFSSLEQLFNINSNLETLGATLKGQGVDPLSFLGTEVSVPGGTVEVKDGEATPVMLDVPAGATSVEASIVGPAGNDVRRVALGTPPSGELEFIYDGKDATGAQVADGNYTVQAEARDANGEVVSVETFIQSQVTGVDLTTEPPSLMLGTRRVSLGDVGEIRSPDGKVT
jgi:flagellar basal-body rod modification protein FlgD